MDMLSVLFSISKIRQCKLKPVEKREIYRRAIYSLLKYLLRDPIFAKATLPASTTVMNTLWFPQGLQGFILSVVSIYRYYAYIS